LIRPGHEMSTHYFSCAVARCSFHKKRAETRYANVVILHPVGSVGHVVHSGASRAQNVYILFFKLGWARCCFHIKHVGTRYTKLVFLHPVGSVGYTVHSDTSGA
jgi:hypothetical protein